MLFRSSMKRSPSIGRQLQFHANLENWAEGMDYCAIPVPANITLALRTKGPVTRLEPTLADPCLDHRPNLYALGVVGNERLCGFPPFVGRPPMALVAAHVAEPREPIEARRRGIPEALAALIMQCLDKRPADRPQTAAEVIAALDTIATIAAHITTASAAKAVPPLRPSRGRLIALLLLIVALGAGAWAASRSHVASSIAPSIVTSRLLIAPFENPSGNARFDATGRIAADRLARRAAQVGSLEVVPSSTVIFASRDSARGTAAWLDRKSVV